MISIVLELDDTFLVQQEYQSHSVIGSSIKRQHVWIVLHFCCSLGRITIVSIVILSTIRSVIFCVKIYIAKGQIVRIVSDGSQSMKGVAKLHFEIEAVLDMVLLPTIQHFVYRVPLVLDVHGYTQDVVSGYGLLIQSATVTQQCMLVFILFRFVAKPATMSECFCSLV